MQILTMLHQHMSPFDKIQILLLLEISVFLKFCRGMYSKHPRIRTNRFTSQPGKVFIYRVFCGKSGFLFRFTFYSGVLTVGYSGSEYYFKFQAEWVFI